MRRIMGKFVIDKAKLAEIKNPKEYMEYVRLEMVKDSAQVLIDDKVVTFTEQEGFNGAGTEINMEYYTTSKEQFHRLYNGLMKLRGYFNHPSTKCIIDDLIGELEQ